MTASEKILDGIRAAAAGRAKEITAEAESRAEEIIAEKTKQADLQAQQIIKEAKKKAVLTESSGKSAADKLLRDAALAKKRELIERAIVSLTDSINAYDDEKYFTCLYALAEKNAMQEKGEIFLSLRDLKRDLTEFKAKTAALGLTLSNTPADINGGFQLKYNDILINCGLSALVNEKRDEITDVINTALFK